MWKKILFLFFLSVRDPKNFEKKLRRSFFLHFVVVVAVVVDANDVVADAVVVVVVAVVVVDDDEAVVVDDDAVAAVANPAKNVSNLTARKQVWNNRLVSHINIPTFLHEMLELVIFMHR